MAGQGEGAPFKFNFSFGGGNTSPTAEAASQAQAHNSDSSVDDRVVEVDASEGETTLTASTLGQLAITPQLSIWKGTVEAGAAAALVGTHAVQRSDLVSGEYEGGFKMWECSMDLAAYTARQWGVSGGPFTSATATAAAAGLGTAAATGDGVSCAGAMGGAAATSTAAARGCEASTEAGAAASANAEADAFAGSGIGACGSGSGSASSGGGGSGGGGGSTGGGGGGIVRGGALESKRVLELGCGAGVPGIVALLAGAEVHFQDYNQEVLRALTIPNVQANAAQYPSRLMPPRTALAADLEAAQDDPETATEQQQQWQQQQVLPRPNARYFAGDWAAFGEHAQRSGMAREYDVVLTAETIYEDQGTRKLLACMKECLRRPGGVAYVAAKSYYFGVGGSTAAFRQLVEQDGQLQIKDGGDIDDGISNKRELLLLTWKEEVAN